MRIPARLRFTTYLSIIASILLVVGIASPVSAAAQSAAPQLPPVYLDVLDHYVWSLPELWLAPGQVIHVTNRDVDRHTFTVDEWAIDENLPSLDTVTVIVPLDAEIGTSVDFYSSVPMDRESGLIGVINVVKPDDVFVGIRLDPDLDENQPASRVSIALKDDFSFEPAIVTVGSGTIIEVENTGVIEHHFVVDDWSVNQTIAPGTKVLVRVPESVQVGSSVDFYCSMPGHEQQGMRGVMRITGNSSEISTVIRTGDGTTITPIDMRPFIPEPERLGEGWSRLRSGSSDSILGTTRPNQSVFPYTGMGAVYVGPEGARVTVVVLPLRTTDVPLSQVNDAVQAVQAALSSSWTIDRLQSATWRSISPPNGCTVAQRTSGIVPTVTMPSGVTSCQLTGVGVAIFVAVEGEFDGVEGVQAADRVVARIVAGESSRRGER